MIKNLPEEERYVIVEDGEPRWVVMSMRVYDELLANKQSGGDHNDEKPKEEDGQLEDLVSFCPTEQEEERSEWSLDMADEDENEGENEPEIYLETLEEEEDETLRRWNSINPASKASRNENWNDIPF